MTNFQENSDQQPPGAPPHQDAGYASSQAGPPSGAPGHQDTSRFPEMSHQQQPWSGPGTHPGPHSQRPSVSIRPALKTTEFWVLVVGSIALLIAAAVTDQGDDGQGFGSQDAWRYVTILAAAFMISRGLTKFGGRHEHDHDSSR